MGDYLIRVIAEIGVNWNSLDIAHGMIRAASQAGCSYCKFQLFNKNTIASSSLKDKLTELILTESDVKELAQTAKRNKIGLILTPMYLEAVDIADKYGTDFIKIRYDDRENIELISKAQDTGKKVLISMPYMPLEPHRMFNPCFRYFYCIPKYPPEFEDFRLEVACTMHGFSSHYPNFICDIAYAINRIHKDAMIEKHVKLNNNCIDAKVSVPFNKLADFIKQLQAIEKFQRLRI